MKQYKETCRMIVMSQNLDYAQIIAKNAKTHTVLIDFFATWCPPCQKLLPILETIAEDNSWSPFLKVIKINIDEYPVIATEYRIQSLPTLVLIGKHESEVREVGRHIGALQEHALHQWLNQYNVRL